MHLFAPFDVAPNYMTLFSVESYIDFIGYIKVGLKTRCQRRLDACKAERLGVWF